MKLIVAITGASTVGLAIKFIENLPKHIIPHLIVSNSAKTTLMCEENNKINFNTLHENILLYDDDTIEANISSGSYNADALIILPCSMNTLAKCAVGISDTLITRVFSVMLKEKKNIILAPREMPYSQIALENMLKLSNFGITIAPPVMGYYSNQSSLEDMENFFIGRWFDMLKIDNNLYQRWEGKSCE